MADRLDAFLAHAGLGSRSDVKRLVRAGRVSLDGVVVKDPGAAVLGRAVQCDGETVSPPRRGVVLVLHKPTGLSCSHDENEAPLVYDLVPKEFRAARLQSVGRLDRETSGLLLLTDDGALNHRLTAPRRAIPKRYAAGFVGRLPHDAVARFKAGMLLSHDEAPTLPARLRVDSPSDGTSVGRAIVEIEEGRYRQVRRMFAALGTTVVELRRERFGALVLPADLCPGAAREATADEIAAASRAPNDRLSEA